MNISLAVLVRGVVLLIALLLGSAATLAAQARLPSIQQGQPLRVTSDLLPGRTVVIFDRFRADTLLGVRRSGEVVSLPLSRIEHLETARRDRVRGALIGAPVGALVLTTGLAIWARSQGGWLDCAGCPFRDDFAVGAVFGVPIGGIAGAITGAIVGTRRWNAVPGIPSR